MSVVAFVAMIVAGVAVPLNDPAGWITTEDYPKSEISRGITGVTAFNLLVSKDGRVADCAVVTSSGSEALDAITCALVRVRAKFKPPKDAQGRKVEATFSQRVRWQLPDDATATLPAGVSTLELAVDINAKGIVENCQVLKRPMGMSETAATPCVNFSTGRQVRARVDAAGKPQAFRMIMRESIEYQPR